MADYLTQFSCMFDLGSTENAARALELLAELGEDTTDDEPLYGFDAEIDPVRPGFLWIKDGGQGEPEHVIAFVLACADAFDLIGRWGFTWALTCSKPRLDGFGGGAHLIDLGQRRTIAWLDCDHWLAGALDPAFDANTGVAQSALPGGEPAMGRGEPVGDGHIAGIDTPSVPAD